MIAPPTAKATLPSQYPGSVRIEPSARIVGVVMIPAMLRNRHSPARLNRISATSNKKGNIDAAELGYWLRDHQARRGGGYQLLAGELTRAKTRKWKVIGPTGGERTAPFTADESQEYRADMADIRQRLRIVRPDK